MASPHEMQSATEAPAQTAESRLWNAIKQIEKATDLVSEISDRLCGIDHTEATDSVPPRNPINGHFDSVDQAARDLSRCMERIAYDMGRISSRL